MEDNHGGAAESAWPKFLTDEVKAAVERNGLDLRPGIIPEFSAVELKQEVEFPAEIAGPHPDDVHSYKLHPNVYHVKVREGEPLVLYALDSRSMIEAFERQFRDGDYETVELEDGTKAAAIDGTVEFQMQLVPVTIGERPKPLTLDELLVWVAVRDAVASGDSDLANRIFAAAYRRVEPAEPEVPSLTGIKPERTYYPVDKATRHLTDPDAWEVGGVPLSVGKKKGQTVIQLALSLDGQLPVKTSEVLDHRDREIIAAVDSIKVASDAAGAVSVISAATVCEAMGELHPEPARQQEVAERMKRLTDVTVTIDYTQEALERKLVDPDTGERLVHAVVSGKALEARVIETTDEQGRTTTRFVLLDHTPSYRHAHEIKQVASWPNELLSLPALKPDGRQYGKSSTPRQTTIKHVVLEHVARARHKKARTEYLSYDALCGDVGVDPGKRSSRKEVVDFAEGYLRALQARGDVKDYQVREIGRSHKKTGVDVFV